MGSFHLILQTIFLRANKKDVVSQETQHPFSAPSLRPVNGLPGS
jgi:hypothetical protein